jgi:hypothetical protein
MKIEAGDQVINQDGLIGYVVDAGPYGDDPFQILSDGRQYHNFIKEDGTSDYNKDLWINVDVVEDLRIEHGFSFDAVFKHVRDLIEFANRAKRGY